MCFKVKGVDLRQDERLEHPAGSSSSRSSESRWFLSDPVHFYPDFWTFIKSEKWKLLLRFLKWNLVYAILCQHFDSLTWLCAHKRIDFSVCSVLLIMGSLSKYFLEPSSWSQMEFPNVAAAPHFWLLKETERSPSGENSPSSLPQCPPWVLTLGLTHLVTHQEFSTFC